MRYVDDSKLVKVKQSGVYADAEGVHHFYKTGAMVPRNYTLVEQVDSLAERQEVIAAANDEPDAKAEEAPENKAEKATEKK